jgi:hypothetical protein
LDVVGAIFRFEDDLIDAAHHDQTGRPSRPRKRFKVLATDKVYDAKALRRQLRKRGIGAQIPKWVWKTKKPHGRPLKKDVLRV